MKLNTITSQPTWKLALKVSALGLSIVLITYSLVWLILSTLQFVVESIYPS